GQQDQPFGVLVQPPHREDALLVADEIDDVALDVLLGGAGHAHRLVERDVHVAAAAGTGRACTQRLPVHEHHVVLAHFRAGTGGLAVDADPARGDQGIGLATGTDPGTGDVLVEAGGHAPFSAPGGPAATTRSRPPR